MRTRDGITLVADAVRPLNRGRYPVILERTPFGREAVLAKAAYWATRGYVYVAQDCRGQGDSTGNWDPFAHEGRDGYDAIAWVARQPWCDGNVGTLGDGYAGTSQWLAATERPPALRCIVPRFEARTSPYEQGTFSLVESLQWARLGLDKRAGLTGPMPNPERLARLPLSDLDRVVLGRTSPVYQNWLAGSAVPDLDRSFAAVPTLRVSGWFGPILRQLDPSNHWLVCGPWLDAAEAAGVSSELEGLTLQFFDTYLKGRSVDLQTVPKVQAFVEGANRWASFASWPSSSASFETQYLAPARLVREAGAQEAAVFVYDPSKDVAKADTLPFGKIPPPAKSTFALFVGDPAPKPTAIAGPFEARLFCKSSAQDTDLFATLVDQSPDGALRRIGQPGKIRASHRNGPGKVEPLKPARIYAVTLRPWDAAYELAKGHRLGLLVNSSLFPRYARNLGTDEPPATAKRSMAQRNVILTGRVTPSRITFRRLW